MVWIRWRSALGSLSLEATLHPLLLLENTDEVQRGHVQMLPMCRNTTHLDGRSNVKSVWGGRSEAAGQMYRKASSSIAAKHTARAT